MMHNKKDFRCEFCHEEQETLYEGWFRHEHRNSQFFNGTVTSGLIQRKRACKWCADKLIKNGTACAEKLPNDSKD